MKKGYYWIEFEGEIVVAERVIDKDDGVDFWHLTGCTDTVYDEEVKVLEKVEKKKETPDWESLRGKGLDKKLKKW